MIQLRGSTRTPTVGTHRLKSMVILRDLAMSWLRLNCVLPPTAATRPINQDTSIIVRYSQALGFVSLTHWYCFCDRFWTANIWGRRPFTSRRDVRSEKRTIHSQTYKRNRSGHRGFLLLICLLIECLHFLCSFPPIYLKLNEQINKRVLLVSLLR